MSLRERRCIPCEGGVAPLTDAELSLFVSEVPAWSVVREAPYRLRRSFDLDDFQAAIAFVNAMADLAEREGHHPDFSVHYRRVDVEIWTHAVGGLTENDFVLAAKIDSLPRDERRPASP